MEFASFDNFFRLVHAQIVHEHWELYPVELGLKHFDECDKILWVDRPRMDWISLETSILTYRSDQSHGFYLCITVFDNNVGELRRPCPFAESVECEDSFIDPDQLLVSLPGSLDSLEHLLEEIEVILIVIVNDFFASFDVLEANAKFIVEPMKWWSWELDLRECAMKHSCSLNER